MTVIGHETSLNGVSRGEECMNIIERSFRSRPKATGIEKHDYRKSDVVITTFPKSGTTLTQYMSYQIVALSGGGPSFDRDGTKFADLAIISPWLDHIPTIGIPPCESSPRILKTHSPVSAFPVDSCRHVVVVRNPLDYPASFLDFVFEALVPESDTLSLADREGAFHECVKRNLINHVEGKGYGGWHNFVVESIYPISPNKLTLFYEDIVADMPKAIRTLAKFMGCTLSDENVEEVVRRCNRKRMANDPRFNCRIESGAFGIPYDMPKAKEARTNGFKQFKVKYDDRVLVEEMNEKCLGERSYENFRKSFMEKQKLFFKNLPEAIDL